MKKLLKTTVIFCLLLAFALLTGCINIEMKVNNNGSADIKYEIRTENMVSLKEIENQLKSGIEETNDAAGKSCEAEKRKREGRHGHRGNQCQQYFLHYPDAFFGKYSDFEKIFRAA